MLHNDYGYSPEDEAQSCLRMPFFECFSYILVFCVVPSRHTHCRQRYVSLRHQYSNFSALSSSCAMPFSVHVFKLFVRCHFTIRKFL